MAAPTAYVAHDAFVTALAQPALEGHVLSLRRALEERTGKVDSEDEGFEARMATFWDAAVTHPDLLGQIAGDVSADVAPWAAAFSRAHRGLFAVASGGATAAFILEDRISGAAFVLIPAPPRELSIALESSEGLFDGRVVGAMLNDAPTITLLPGAFFHPPDASEAILGVIAAARTAGRSRDETLDALLRMEARLRAHSRVKPSYAYRPESI